MKAPAFAHLTRALSMALPTPVETSFLRACLGSGAPARQAWDDYRRRAGDLRARLATDRRGLKGLMPLLLDAVRRNRLDADPALLTVLRTAHVHESRRSETVRDIVRRVIVALNAGALPHVVLDGVALAETAYAHPALRHCGTLELLLRPDDLPRASHELSALASPALGVSPATAADDRLALRHGTGFPIELRSRLATRCDHVLPPPEALVTDSCPATIAGVPTRVLSPSDRLLDVCVRGFVEGRRSGLAWAADAWHVLHRSPDLDWETLLERSRKGHLALPLLVTLGYLGQQLDAPVPPAVLEGLREAAARIDSVQAEKVLAMAVVATPDLVQRLLAMGGGWASRLTVAKWMLLPSRGYLRASHPQSPAWLLPVYYVYRPLRFATRRLARPDR